MYGLPEPPQRTPKKFQTKVSKKCYSTARRGTRNRWCSYIFARRGKGGRGMENFLRRAYSFPGPFCAHIEVRRVKKVELGDR